MIYNMRGDTYHAGPVMLSDVYTSAVGSAKDGVAASQRALYEAYNSLNSSVIDNIYPVGSLYMSINPTLPEALSTGRTWQLLSGGYVLKTIETGTGGETTNATATGGPSNNTSGTPSNNTSGTPSNNTSGSTTLTAAQSGMPAHNLDSMKGKYVNIGSGTYAGTWFGDSGNAVSINVSKGVNASQGHTHTLSNHTHSLNNHTHTLSSHTHTTGMPANIGVYIWKRTK